MDVPGEKYRNGFISPMLDFRSAYPQDDHGPRRKGRTYHIRIFAPDSLYYFICPPSSGSLHHGRTVRVDIDEDEAA